MVDRRIEIWNLFHDGKITAFSGEGSDTVTMFVSIPYLRRRLHPPGDSFVITLSGLTCLEFRDSNGNTTSMKEVIEAGHPEILSTDSVSMPVKIVTTTGQLTLDFQSIGFDLDTGQSIQFEAIHKVSEEYWNKWKAKRVKRRPPCNASGPGG